MTTNVMITNDDYALIFSTSDTAGIASPIGTGAFEVVTSESDDAKPDHASVRGHPCVMVGERIDRAIFATLAVWMGIRPDCKTTSANVAKDVW